jgi:hypothetical protein
MSTSRIPTRREINVYDCLDGRRAERNFFGKDLSQAEAMFRDNLFGYAEDLMWMGPVAFCYYFDAAAAYLLDPTLVADVEDLSAFCTAVEFQLEYHREAIEPARPRLLEVVRRYLARPTSFRGEFVDYSPYGDELERRYSALEQRLLSNTF